MKKNIISLLLLCMVINFLVPKFSIEPEDCSAVSQLIKKQSALLYFFSLSAVPLKIVNDMFAGQAPQSKNSGKRPDKNSVPCANTSSDYSLVGSSAQNNIKNEFVRAWLPYINTLVLSSVFERPLYRYFGTGHGSGILFLLTLMFFFLRPRSSIDDALIFSCTRK